MATDHLKIVKELVFETPNLLLPAPAIFLVLTCPEGALKQEAIDRILGFLGTVSPSFPKPSEAPRGLEERIGAGIAHTAAYLQEQIYPGSGTAVSAPRSSAGVIEVGFECHHAKLGLLAARAGVEFWSRAVNDDASAKEEFYASFLRFKGLADAALRFGTQLLLREARKRDIPLIRVLDRELSVAAYREILQLGQGCKQARFLKGINSKSLQLGCELATQKSVTAQLLGEQGIPVPPHGLAGSEAEAIAIARRLGYPVVAKPNNQDNGVAVHVNIEDDAKLKGAFADIVKFGPVQVEKQIAGFDHRITFIGDRLVGVLQILPASISGDGASTVRSLLEADTVRTTGAIIGKITIDDEVREHLRGAGVALDDVLPKGKRIILRRWWRSRDDHSLKDVTVATHPDNIAIARSAAMLLGLDIAGIDYITTDISKSYRETGGAIVEVNSLPTLAGAQMCGLPAYPILLDHHFPDGSNGRIPTAVIVGENGAAATELAAHLLQDDGSHVGVCSEGRLSVGGRVIGRTLSDDANRANVILRDPQCSVALFQTSADAISRSGMPLDKCEIGVILPREAPPDERDMEAIKLLFSVSSKAVIVSRQHAMAASFPSLASNLPLIWIEDDVAAIPSAPAASSVLTPAKRQTLLFALAIASSLGGSDASADFDFQSALDKACRLA
jgi:cyanophycin synthetase